MQTTTMHRGTSETQRGGSHPRDAHDMRVFLKRFALRGRDPAVGDENLYRYCGDDPLNATDPSGLDPTPPSDFPSSGAVRTYFGNNVHASDSNQFFVGGGEVSELSARNVRIPALELFPYAYSKT